LTSIGTIISQTKTATGMLTWAKFIRPSAWNGAGTKRPSPIPTMMHSATHKDSQRSKMPSPVGAGRRAVSASDVTTRRYRAQQAVVAASSAGSEIAGAQHTPPVSAAWSWPRALSPYTVASP
jgi:hypothetical protein